MTFSIVIPIYNEENTLANIVSTILAIGINYEYELILVDDGSTDNSRKIISDLQKQNKNIKSVFNKINLGKTDSIKAGMLLATGDYIAIQDADLEYSPKDLFSIFDYIERTKMPVVYGSRVLGTNNTAYPFYYAGSRFITSFFNMLFGYKLTDLTTCYKVFNRELVSANELHTNRFGFCPEITCNFARKRAKIAEVPISYAPRSFEEGKKIRVYDGMQFLWIITKSYLLHLKQLYQAK